MNNVQDYIYSSASNYIIRKGLLDIICADVPVTDTSKTLGIKRDMNYS